jgi:hypothetical protein
VTLLFPLSELGGRDATTFHLLELSILDGQTWVQVAPCVGDPPDQSQFTPGTDSCVLSQTNVKINGTNYVQDVLDVVGSPPDGHYGG